MAGVQIKVWSGCASSFLRAFYARSHLVLQVLGVVKNWLEEHWSDFEDTELRQQLKEFLNGIIHVRTCRCAVFRVSS